MQFTNKLINVQTQLKGPSPKTIARHIKHNVHYYFAIFTRNIVAFQKK